MAFVVTGVILAAPGVDECNGDISTVNPVAVSPLLLVQLTGIISASLQRVRATSRLELEMTIPKTTHLNLEESS